jgi:CzcA family heavy metal efflux pump
MIDRIIHQSLVNRALVLTAAGLLLLWGAWSLWHAPLDVFPDLTAPAVTIVAEAHGMPPEEIETLVTFPVETAMNGASGVRRVRSSIGVGITVITVEFDWGTDMYRARQIVAEKLQQARAELPPDLPAPVLAPVTSIMGEILFIALLSDRHSEMELKTTADWTLRRRLLAVPGVAEVLPTGGETRQYQVIAQPERLSAYRITLNELLQAVRETNRNAAAGFVTENNQEFLIRGFGRAHDIEDIGATFIAQRGGVPVFVRDVASVKIGTAPRRGTGAYKGIPAVILGIQKQPDVNTLALTKAIDAAIADIQEGLPEGMRVETDAFRQADFIRSAVDNLSVALRDGAILVIAIVFAFLLSVRATLIALIAIPLSLLVAVLLIQYFGGTLNTMTLGGMAIALGALVDDAIIVVENIMRRLREDREKPVASRRNVLEVVFEATREIQSSIFFATLIIILVFLPLFFLQGVEGRLLAPLGFAYVVSLTASLLVALTVTPVACYLLLPQTKAIAQNHDSHLIGWLKRTYRPLLSASLQHWCVVITLSIMLLLLSIAGLMAAGRAFLPEFNEGSLTISVVTLPGTSLETSNGIGAKVEAVLLKQPEVVATARRTGRAEQDPHAMEVFASEIDVTLAMQERNKAELLAALRQEFSAFPGTNIVIGQPISHRIDHMLSGTRANIAVKIFGEELSELRRLGKQIETRIKSIPGTADVAMEQQAEIPYITLRFDREALARYGLRIADISETVETIFAGTEVGRVLEGQAGFDLIVRYSDEVRENLQAIRQTLITTASGAQLPLAAVADIQRERGINNIGRENVQRKLVVLVNVAGRDLVSVVEDIRQAVRSDIQLPAGYHIEYGGQFESAESAALLLSVLGCAVIAGIFILLMVAFRSARDASLVMLNLPLALIGGVVGVWLTDGIISIASFIGFITLFGIATRNGVILVDHIRRLVYEDKLALETAIQQGAEERLVPILMTALATALALVPLALAAGEPGSEIQAPMAIVILFGLLSSTALNMLVVPAMCLHFSSVAKPA